MMRPLLAVAILAAMPVPAIADIVTSEDQIVCLTEPAVEQVWTAIANKPENVRISDIMAPLGCAYVPGDTPFISVAEFGSVTKGLLVTPKGATISIYTMTTDLRTK